MTPVAMVFAKHPWTVVAIVAVFLLVSLAMRMAEKRWSRSRKPTPWRWWKFWR